MLPCPSLLYFKIMDLFFLNDGMYVSFFRILKHAVSMIVWTLSHDGMVSVFKNGQCSIVQKLQMPVKVGTFLGLFTFLCTTFRYLTVSNI